MIFGLHQKYEHGKGETIYISSAGKKAKKYSDVTIEKWIKTLTKTSVVRLVNPNGFNKLLLRIVGISEKTKRPRTAAQLVYGYWHDTSIPKGTEPPEIAALLAKADPAIFHPLNLRTDLINLRKAVRMRKAFVDLRTGLSNKLFQIEGKTLRELSTKQAAVAKDFDGMIADELRNVIRVASTISECIVLQKVMRQEALLTPAQILASLGDPLRFHSVGGLWHYCGFHVVDGKAPKHRFGENSNFKGELRTIMHVWAECMVRGKNRYWRPRFNAHRATVDKTHPEWSKGHRMNHALRMIAKECLKQFWIRTHINIVESKEHLESESKTKLKILQGGKREKTKTNKNRQ